MRRILLLAVSLFLALPAFSQSASFTINRLQHNMTVVGDFNNDGREDGIVFTETSTTSGFHAEISSGTAAYSSGPSYSLPSGSRTRSYAVADFNNDGKLDLAVTTADSKLLLYLGEGNGSFQSPKTIALPFVASSLKPADVNHDGKMDLVMVNGPSNAAATIVSYFGDGGGGFTAGPSSPFGGNYAINGTGDFDGDGKADLLSVNCDPGGCNFTIYFGDGAGSFGNPVQNGTGQTHFSIADVDGDGLSDIIATNEHYINGTDAQYLMVFYGSADRTLSAVQIPTSQCAFETPVAADFNGDHMPDIIFFEHDCVDNPDGQQDVQARMALLPGTGSRTAFGPEQVIYFSRYAQQPGYDARVLRGNNSDAKPDLYFSELADSSGSFPANNNLLINNTVNNGAGAFAGCNAPNSVGGFRICSPAPGSSVGSPVNFSFAAAGSVPMRKVEVWSDGTKLIENFYAFSDYAFIDSGVTMAPGTHAVTLIAAGWDNSIQQTSFNVTVFGGHGCTTGNTITVCSPTAGSTVSSPVSVKASTTLGNPTYRFEPWNGSTKLFSAANSNTMNTSVSLPAGTHKLAFVARLSDGTRKELDVTFTVK